MEITCPQCASKFNLPDQLAKPGAKLRCTVCKNVFQLPGKAPEAPRSEPGKNDGLLPPIPARRPRKWRVLAAILAIAALAGAGVGAYFWFEERAPVENGEDLARRLKDVTMLGVRQYNLANDKVGKVFVIEGKVVNESGEPKELIELEGAIFDKDKKPLAVKRQLAGTQLSLFQLQVLSEKEMESFLNNKMEILANNTNVPPNGEVPFMILFYDPPDNAAEFGVKIVDVKNAPPVM